MEVPDRGVLFRTILLGLALPLVIVGAVAGSPLAPTMTMQTFEEADHSYRSVGEMALPFPPDRVRRLMLDWESYDRWAPRGQDGRDSASSRYVGQLTGVKPGPGYLDLIYRVNLFWPLGSSGQVGRLWVTFPPTGPATLERVRLVLRDTSFAVLKLEGDFSLVEGEDGTSRVRFDSQLKLAWFLRPFFPLDGYRTHVVHRIETALRSFAQEVASQVEGNSSGSASQSPGPASSSVQSSNR